MSHEAGPKAEPQTKTSALFSYCLVIIGLAVTFWILVIRSGPPYGVAPIFPASLMAISFAALIYRVLGDAPKDAKLIAKYGIWKVQFGGSAAVLFGGVFIFYLFLEPWVTANAENELMVALRDAQAENESLREYSPIILDLHEELTVGEDGKIVLEQITSLDEEDLASMMTDLLRPLENFYDKNVPPQKKDALVKELFRRMSVALNLRLDLRKELSTLGDDYLSDSVDSAELNKRFMKIMQIQMCHACDKKIGDGVGQCCADEEKPVGCDAKKKKDRPTRCNVYADILRAVKDFPYAVYRKNEGEGTTWSAVFNDGPICVGAERFEVKVIADPRVGKSKLLDEQINLRPAIVIQRAPNSPCES